MMHQDPTATRQFPVAGVCVATVDGDPDTLAYYDPTSAGAWLTMDDPVDVRAYR